MARIGRKGALPAPIFPQKLKETNRGSLFGTFEGKSENEVGTVICGWQIMAGAARQFHSFLLLQRALLRVHSQTAESILYSGSVNRWENCTVERRAANETFGTSRV
jgi:hypothetical protein